MKGQPPLHLFATLARDSRLAKKFFAGGLLDKGNLTIRQREVVIHRTTALCRSEYEWGVHVTAFAQHAGLTPEQVHSTAAGTAEDACWTPEDRVLIRLCDALHETCDIDDGLWQDLKERFNENAIYGVADARRVLPDRQLPHQRAADAAGVHRGAVPGVNGVRGGPTDSASFASGS